MLRAVLNIKEIHLKAYLEQFISTDRLMRMKSVLKNRTRYVVCVLEDLYDYRNGSAVLRHCDALGIQEVHAIENKNHFKSDVQVDMGTSQWLDLTIHHSAEGVFPSVKKQRESGNVFKGRPNSARVLKALKKRGYRIVATSPYSERDVVPELLDLAAAPVAVVFGSEKHGISDSVREMADDFVRIPMVGFVESFNISASAAIVLYNITRRLRCEGLPWWLSQDDAEEIYFRWVKGSAPHSEQLIQRFWADYGQGFFT